MQTVADMRGVGVKNRGKCADVLCGRPPSQIKVSGDRQRETTHKLCCLAAKLMSHLQSQQKV